MSPCLWWMPAADIRCIRRLVRRYPDFADWLDYVETTYIAVNSPFPPPVWNVYERGVDTRTNNHLEGKWHITSS